MSDVEQEQVADDHAADEAYELPAKFKTVGALVKSYEQLESKSGKCRRSSRTNRNSGRLSPASRRTRRTRGSLGGRSQTGTAGCRSAN